MMLQGIKITHIPTGIKTTVISDYGLPFKTFLAMKKAGMAHLRSKLWAKENGIEYDENHIVATYDLGENECEQYPNELDSYRDSGEIGAKDE